MQNQTEGCSEKQRNVHNGLRPVHFGAPLRRRPARDDSSADGVGGTPTDCAPDPSPGDTPESPYLLVRREEFSDLIKIAQSLTGAIVRLYAWAAATGRRLGIDDLPLIAEEPDLDTVHRSTPTPSKKGRLSKNMC